MKDSHLGKNDDTTTNTDDKSRLDPNAEKFVYSIWLANGDQEKESTQIVSFMKDSHVGNKDDATKITDDNPAMVAMQWPNDFNEIKPNT